MDYTFYSSFLMICECKSFTHIENVNLYISVKLQTNKYNEKYLINTDTKPEHYTICLHDMYKNEYWIYTEENNNIKELILKYVEENNKKYDMCFIEMKLFLLQKLINYDSFLFRLSFINYYAKITTNQEFIGIYYEKFINILDDIIKLNQLEPNKGETKIGVYLITNHDDFFDEILNKYCISPYTKKGSTDANFIITCINILCK